MLRLTCTRTEAICLKDYLFFNLQNSNYFLQSSFSLFHSPLLEINDKSGKRDWWLAYYCLKVHSKRKKIIKKSYIRLLTMGPGEQQYAIRGPEDLLLSCSRLVPPVSSPFGPVFCQHKHYSTRNMSPSTSISCWSWLKFFYLERVTRFPVYLNEVLIDGPELLTIEMCTQMCLYKQGLQTSPSEWALTACDTASREQPASVTKSSVSQAGFLKEKTKCFVGFWHRRSLLQHSGSHSALFSRLGGQCLMLAGASIRSKSITCCWFIVSSAGRERSELNCCIVLKTLNWFCSGITGDMPNGEVPAQVFPKVNWFHFQGAAVVHARERE